MSGIIRITDPLLEVLAVLISASDQSRRHGWAIAKATGRSGPTVYGLLDRLEDAGWIYGEWEDRTAEPNKPRRRFYRLTAAGESQARALLQSRRPDLLPTRTSVRPNGTRAPRLLPDGAQ